MDIPLTQTLCRVFEHHLGHHLSHEVAAKMVAEVVSLCYPGPLPVARIPAKTVGSYRIYCAAVKDALVQLRKVHEEHWHETEHYRHGIPYNPDYARVVDMDQQGRALLVVVEHEKTGELVGNYGLYLSRSVHTQTLIATEDTLFISKPHRRGRLAIELMRYAEAVLVSLGVRELEVSVKLTNNVGPMIERMGFTPTGKQYVKLLEEPANVLP